MWPKQFKLWLWLFSMCVLKEELINVQPCLIRELGHSVTEASKNICCAKDEGTVDHRAWYFTRVARTSMIRIAGGRLKTVESEAVHQAIKVDPANSTWRVLAWLNPMWDLSIASGAAELCFKLPKYCKTFDSFNLFCRH